MNLPDFFSEQPTRADVYRAAEALIQEGIQAREGLQPDEPMSPSDRDRINEMALELAGMARRAGLSLGDVLQDVRRNLDEGRAE